MVLLFHSRRVSRDRVVTQRILELAQGKTLWMSDYSRPLFPPEADIRTGSQFLADAAVGDYCFLENESALACAAQVEQVILFRWNRDYPADFFFDLALNAPIWHLSHREEFPGFSHEKITMEVYDR